MGQVVSKNGSSVNLKNARIASAASLPFYIVKGSAAIGDYSHTEGQNTKAIGLASHTEGTSTIAMTNNDHAEGSNTEASGGASHAEGVNSISNGAGSHAEGYNTKSQNQGSHSEGYGRASYWINANASGAHAEGFAYGGDIIASGDGSHAEGYSFNGVIQATKKGSHAEGYGRITSSGEYGSHAEGYYTIASGQYGSHAEGDSTTASGSSSHAEGSITYAFGNGAHAEGKGTRASSSYTHAEGYYTNANAFSSHAEGEETVAAGQSSHAEGGYPLYWSDEDEEWYTDDENDNSSISEGWNSHAEGGGTLAQGPNSHAEGELTIAIGKNSHAEGGMSENSSTQTIARGINSHAEGSSTRAFGESSHSEGELTYIRSNGNSSHAEGLRTEIYAAQSHTEGIRTQVGDSTQSGKRMNSAFASHAEGEETVALRERSHVEGFHTWAEEEAAHAEGRYTHAKGKASHAEGEGGLAVGKGSHAEGNGALFDIIGGFNSDTNTFYNLSFKTKPLKYNKNPVEFLNIGDFIGCQNQVGVIQSIDYENETFVVQGLSLSSFNGGYTRIWILKGAAKGDYSHSEGIANYAEGKGSHAEGYNTLAANEYSHTEGKCTQATNEAEHAEGKYNLSHLHTISSIGIGADKDNRLNAIEVIDNGDVYIKGIGNYDGTTLKNPNDDNNHVLPIQEALVSTAQNHYTPTNTNTSDIVGVLNGTASATDSCTALTGVTATVDSKNHLLGLKYTASTIANTKVTQQPIPSTQSNNNSNFSILLSNSTDSSNTTETNFVNKTNKLQFNNYTGTFKTQNVELTGTLNVTGQTTLSDNLSAQGITATNLQVTGNTTFNQIPQSVTPAATSNDGSIATTAFVKNSVAGLSGAMHFIGTTSSNISDGSTLNPILLTSNNAEYTAVAGDVVLCDVGHTGNVFEYVWNDAVSAWEMLGRDTNFKIRQNPISDISNTSGNATTFVSSVTQNENGEIAVTKKVLDTSGAWTGTAAKLSDLTTTDQASNSDTWRRVWFSYNDNVTGRPAYDDTFVYQSSTKTLKARHFQVEHQSGGQDEFRVTYGSTVDMAFMIGTSNANHGIYDHKANKWMVYADGSGNVTVNGNALTATKATQDGSGNNIVNTYLTKAAGVTAVTWDNNSKTLKRTINGTAAEVLNFTAGNGISLTAAASSLTITSNITATGPVKNDTTEKYTNTLKATSADITTIPVITIRDWTVSA